MKRRAFVTGAAALVWARRLRAATAPVIDADDHVLGDAAAPIRMFEFASLTCPHCARFAAETLPLLQREWIDPGRAAFVFRPFPIDRLALDAAKIAERLPRAQFFRFVAALYETQNGWMHAADPTAAIGRIARVAGLTEGEIEDALADDALTDRLLRGKLAARNELDVRSTPSFLIGAQRILGAQPYAVFAAALAAASPG